MKTEATDEELESLLEYLKVSRGFDFTGYKRSTLTRRILKRMQAIGLETYSAYTDYLRVEPPEVSELFNSILINVTSFFRDPQEWKYVSETVIPAILEKKQPGAPIRVWSAGCASGEEAYTIAILFAERLGIEEAVQRVKIYATDLDSDALTSGRQAVYGIQAVSELPGECLEKYFQKSGEQFTFHRDLRKMVIFGKHNLLTDIPISQIDLLSCRNTLMYFNAEAQDKILKRLHFALADEGYFILGKAEMLLLRTGEYEPLDVRRRIFTKGRKSSAKDRLLLMTQALGDSGSKVSQSQIRLAEASFEQDPLAQIIVDAEGNLVLANQHSRRLFNIPHDAVGKSFREVEISYRPVDLIAVAREASITLRPVVLEDVELRTPTSETRYVDIHVAAIGEANDGVLGTRFVFSDVTRVRQLKDDLEQRKQELETAYEELQSSNEELTTTNEELQSTVEELETTNEELQSTNEELETMNEELQSTNEELENINAEVESKSNEVLQLNLFLDCILSSLKSAVIVVNAELFVLLWNDKCEELWGLRTEEVLNEHLFSLDIGMPLEQLRPCVKQCFNDVKEQPEKVLRATNRRGKKIVVCTTCRPVVEKGSDKAQGVLILIDLVAEDGKKNILEAVAQEGLQ
jgi:two-component system CheB/CheR fusion protein